MNQGNLLWEVKEAIEGCTRKFADKRGDKMVSRIEVGWRQGEKEGTIPVDVVYSKRRTIGLEVQADGKVLIRVPKGITKKALMDFVNERQEWIVEKWFLVETRRQRKAARPKADYEENPEVEAFYRRAARKKIVERTAWYAKIMGVTYGRISIRAAKTRWGSCSGEGNLNFHWKLILMPPEILDYVVVHELAHRKQMNHSALFWAEVGKVLPDYKARRAWLKENGSNY